MEKPGVLLEAHQKLINDYSSLPWQMELALVSIKTLPTLGALKCFPFCPQS